MHKQIFASMAMALVMVAAPALTMNQEKTDPEIYLSSEESGGLIINDDAGIVLTQEPEIVGENDCLLYYSNGYIEKKASCDLDESSQLEKK